MSRRLSVSQVFNSTNPEVKREPYGHLKIYESDAGEIDGAATALQHAANENGFGQSEDAPDRFIAKMKGMGGSTMKTLCQGGISDDPPEGEEEGGFYTEAFKTADIIITSHDSNGSLRGFCCVKKNHTFDDEEKPGYLYITLICNATKHDMSSRQGVQHAAGKNILLFLAEYAMKGGWDAIALSAIEEVITYYYKFGYRFIKKCGDKEKDWMKEDIDNLKRLIIKKFKTEKRGLTLDTKDEKAYEKALLRFKRYGDDTGNIYTGPSRTDFEELKQDVRDDDGTWAEWWNEWKEENTKLLLDDPTPKEGYKMIWCANDPKGVAGAGDFKAYLAAIEAAGFTKKPMSKKKPGANTGGRRRTRRRKKKTKKKTRKKKRRMRRKRGGCPWPSMEMRLKWLADKSIDTDAATANYHKNCLRKENEKKQRRLQQQQQQEAQKKRDIAGDVRMKGFRAKADEAMKFAKKVDKIYSMLLEARRAGAEPEKKHLFRRWKNKSAAAKTKEKARKEKELKKLLEQAKNVVRAYSSAKFDPTLAITAFVRNECKDCPDRGKPIPLFIQIRNLEELYNAITKEYTGTEKDLLGGYRKTRRKTKGHNKKRRRRTRRKR